MTGIIVDELTLEDFSVETIASEDGVAVVEVAGRLNAGPPVGSTQIDDAITVRHDGDGWCLEGSSILTTGLDTGEESGATEANDVVGERSGRLLPHVYRAHLHSSRGSDDCVTIRYPEGWGYYSEPVTTSRCPSGGAAIATQDSEVCDVEVANHSQDPDIHLNNSEGIAFTLEFTDEGTPPSIGLQLQYERCAAIDEQLLLLRPYPIDSWPDDLWVLADEPVFQTLEVVGVDSRCIDAAYAIGKPTEFGTAVQAEAVQYFACLFDVGGHLYRLESVALPSRSDEERRLIEDVFSSLAVDFAAD